jgi:two-component system phosphate regulon response regulator PhoB
MTVKLTMKTAPSHILVIEDEADILSLLTYSLKREGYEVTGLASGEQALQIIPQKMPHLILLDLMMPGLSGSEICRLLKAKPETARIPVIMVTAKGEDTDIVQGLELGADDYITKPFNMKVLLARIHTALRRREPQSPQPDELPKAQDTVINLLRQVEGGLLSKIFESR